MTFHAGRCKQVSLPARQAACKAPPRVGTRRPCMGRRRRRAAFWRQHTSRPPPPGPVNLRWRKRARPLLRLALAWKAPAHRAPQTPPIPQRTRRFEGSGLTFANGHYWVIFDSLETIAKVDLRFSFRCGVMDGSVSLSLLACTAISWCGVANSV